MKLKSLHLIIVTAVAILLLFSCQDQDLDPAFERADVAAETSHDFNKRICLSQEHTNHLLLDPEYRRIHDKYMKSFEKMNSQPRLKLNCSSPTIVPVAVHYQGVSNADESCLRQLAIDQVIRMNLDFQGTNTDINKWTSQAASAFGGISNGEMCVEFVIANKNHPSGYGLSEGQPAITINRTQGDQVNQWSGYINIFVQFNTGSLGYAPLGGFGNGDGVVIDATGFGAGSGCGNVAPEAPFNLGRTLTHEMGHYLLLDHIWGDGCGVDDLVSDTPDQAQDYSGCPGIGQSSCGSADLHMNYMDYTNDACMYMFSAGQVSRMTNYLMASLSSVVSNASNVYNGASSGGNNGDGGNEDDNNGGGNDDVSSCSTPSQLGFSNISQNSARASWSSVTDAESYQLRFRPVGTSSYTVRLAQGNSFVLTSLSAATEYEVAVRTVCAQSSSDYSTFQRFETSQNTDDDIENSICQTPTAILHDLINDNTVSISWEEVQDAVRYQVRYRIEGRSWTRRTSNSNESTLRNLSAELYEYQVRTRCASGWTTWSAMGSFDLGQTDQGGGQGGGNYRVLLTVDDYGSETTWALYNDQNDILSQGGPYQDGRSGTSYSKDVSLGNGCYEIDLYDDFGDGICCEYGQGKLEVFGPNNQVIASSDGQFGTYELIQLCIDEGRARIVKREKDQKKKIGRKK